MQDIKIDGIGNFSGGEYSKVIVDGVTKCNGEIKAENIEIDGKFQCLGKVTADVLDCDGMAEFEADIIAKIIKIDGYLTVNKGAKMYAQSITCDGFLSVDGQISADDLNLSGFLLAKEIVGDKIKVKSNISRISKLFLKKFSKVELIEATTIELCGVKAQTVNGNDITIGENCEIDSLDCSGTLFIDKKSVVKNITGNYTIREK